MNLMERSHDSNFVMVDDIDQLPTEGVGEFIRSFARAHDVAYCRTRLDDWAEAVTRAAGDDIQLDPTEKLLVSLKKLRLINGRQAARLLSNYMDELERVRSVP